MSRSYKIYTAPAIEPITLAQARRHLRLDSGTFASETSSSQSIAPGSHVVAPTFSLKGTGIDVSAATNVLVLLEAGANGNGGTVDVKLQESNTDVDGNYTDVPSGAFTQVTTSNDNATYELAYTGAKKYLRAVATVAGAACEFAVSILLDTQTHADDDDITDWIKTARIHCENIHNRAYITQTWDLYLDQFPSEDYIKVPKPPLQTVSYVKYKDTAGVLQTMASSLYIVDIVSEPGRIVLANGQIWPSTYDEIQAVQIRFLCGYGATADTVPSDFKSAMKLKITDLYEHRGDGAVDKLIEDRIMSLLWPDRIAPI